MKNWMILLFLLVVVCFVVWMRNYTEPFETKKIHDFFNTAEPYMEEAKQLYTRLKKTDASLPFNKTQ